MISTQIRVPRDKKIIVIGLGHFLHKNRLSMRSKMSSTRQEVSQTGGESIFAPRDYSRHVSIMFDTWTLLKADPHP